MLKRSTALSLVIASLSAPTLAQDLALNSLPKLETVRIIGTQVEAREVSGSSAVVEPQQMQIEVVTDINQVLKTVPGVYVQEEEGYGLRPNIGIRAASSGR
ncbi:TonB-dependent receptor plug domain-containing protein, partial [Marinimicrobium sp. UBA4509]